MKQNQKTSDVGLHPGHRKDRQFVTALARGLEVLRGFAPNEQFLGNQEIAKRTGLPKPTVSRLTYTLTRLGYLKQSETRGKYALNTGVLSLGYALLANVSVRQIARPLMQALADYSQGSVAMCARDRLNMVYIESCRGKSTVTLSLGVGSHVPIATTAAGRALMAALPERERDFLLGHLRKRYPEDWPKINQGMDQALKDYRQKGFCCSLGDWQKQVNAVGVPLIEASVADMLVFTCGGPAFQLRRAKLEEDIGPRLVNLVRQVEAAAGRDLLVPR